MTNLAAEEWRLVREESWSGPMNMALDEIAAETAAAGGPRTVRVYRWEPSTLSLGYHQDPATIDWAYCDREGVTVTRRQTGGGAIYHDNRGDISYSVTAPAAAVPGDLMETYRLFCEPLLDALDGMGVEAGYAQDEKPAVHQPACYLRKRHPAHDVVADDGRKLSGNAQYRQRDAVIQHGSLTHTSRPERHLAVFATEDVTPAEFEARVTSVHEQSGCGRERAVSELTDALAAWCDAVEGDWTADELSRARERAEKKYGADEWVRDRTDPTSLN
ncbi:lipoate--protein ligase family protein [Halorientalis litorea]|uniref:lipoate--protein ligase family protein n=1 Tax=Halorientalis litorea TaxID=2931977 RepID=UPI001FF16BFC|nr:biotin/lipoate A/B protein ligase family protein [Halorientalis litorea]